MTTASEHPLVVDGAEKHFGSVQALAGAGLDVRRGELVGLLGPNGAGKTTMIKAIAGRLKLDAGTVRLFGRALAQGDPRPEIGVVPQELAVYPLLTASENLEVFGALYGVNGAALVERVTWALEWSDLKDRAHEPVKRFSGGMKRRLNIACSLLHRPSVVLLDEPTAGVDPQSRERIYEMLADLQRAGVSMVLTTHHLEEAERRCERIVIIDRGRIAAGGTLSELLAQSTSALRTVKITLAKPLPDSVTLPSAMIDADRRFISAEIRDLGAEVPALVGAIAASGAELTGLEVAGTSLQDLFIGLTGRELRE
jgi:ABC-2 type transport system ATP-binding protein